MNTLRRRRSPAPELERAIRAGAIDVAFQRIVELPSLRTVKCEALARWHHPRLGTVPPDLFIPLAEELGLIGELDHLVLDRALGMVAGARDGHLPDLAVAVNLSPTTLAVPDTVDRVLAALERHRVPPSALWVEATESALIGDEATASLAALTRVGVRVLIDDFGTGYSSLSYLSRLPLDGLKIDRSFVAAMHRDPAAVAVIRSVVGLGAELGIVVVAEGVETGADERLLRRLGLRFMQGYRYSVPGPAAEVLPGGPAPVPPQPAPPPAPPMPADEPARLAALGECDVLDTPPEPAFDSLTRLAAETCGVPLAFVSLVDRDRQWFKARVGSDLTETPRDVSFCTHVAAGREMLVVPDAAADGRFAGSPLVVDGPKVRFYAGAPLVTADGHTLGTLCVLDRRPRHLDEHQLRVLRELADQVTSCLELRRATARLAEAARVRDQAEAALQRAVSLDPLTQVVARGPFLDRLEIEAATGCTLVGIDLHGLRSLNEDHGPRVGDGVLRWAGRVVSGVIDDGGVVGRIGAGEFAALVPGADLAAAAALARRLRSALAAEIVVEGRALEVSAAVAIVACRPGDDLTHALRRLGRALADAAQSPSRSTRNDGAATSSTCIQRNST